MNATVKKLFKYTVITNGIAMIAAAAVIAVDVYRVRREYRRQAAKRRGVVEAARRRVMIWFPVDMENYRVAARYVEDDATAKLNLDNSFHFLISVLECAKQDLKIMIYTFSDEVLAKLITKIASRTEEEDRPKVRIVVDRGEFKKQHAIQQNLRKLSQFAEIKVHNPTKDNGMDGNLLGYMHHKVVIIDDLFLATGSLNFTTAALQRNQEGMMFVHKPDVVKMYIDEFEKVWESSLEPEWAVRGLAEFMRGDLRVF